MNPEYFKISQIFNDYLQEKEKLKPFYSVPLYPDWQKLTEKVHNSFNQNDVLLELIDQNKSQDGPKEKENLKLLKQEKTVVVVTGQQMGLMVSPLYIIYKTLSTLKLAEQLNKQFKDFNFVPVFWLEGEDHDYEEVCKLTVPDKSGKAISFSLDEKKEEVGFSLNKRNLADKVNDLLDELKSILQETEFSQPLFERLHSEYQPGNNWLQAFKNHLSELFNGTGLLYFDAGSEKIKQLSKSFFEKVIIENEALVSLFDSKSAELKKAGYDNQVNILADRAYLFLSYNDGPRLPLLRKGSDFYLKEIDQEFTLDQLLALLDEHPNWFSSTVLTRPLWQSWLLPTVSYVAGGAEIAYWAQLRSAFNHLLLPMPQVQPRHSMTLIEPRTQRLLEKYEIDINKIPAGKSRFIKEYFSRNMLKDVNDLFSKFEDQAIESRDQVKRLVNEIDPTLLSPTEKSYQSVIQNIEKLHNRLVNRLKEKDETTQKHLVAIHEAILPEGVLQERIISALYFQNKYGPEWVANISEKLNENFSQHTIVEL